MKNDKGVIVLAVMLTAALAGLLGLLAGVMHPGLFIPK